MATAEETILINVNIEISTDALETIVATAKKILSEHGAGANRVDTADRVSEMVSKFLLERNFTEYVSRSENYLP
jgi:hypothetical protein